MSPCHSEPSTIFVNDIFKVREANAFESGNLIYAINTKSCNMSYIGETGSKVADRYREYLIDIFKEASKQFFFTFDTSHLGYLFHGIKHLIRRLHYSLYLGEPTHSQIARYSFITN